MPKLKTASTRKAKRRDKVARWVITSGGIVVIASVVAILALIVGVTLPLFRGTQAHAVGACDCSASCPKAKIRCLGIDMDMDGANVTSFVWSESGSVAWIDLRTGRLIGREELKSPGGKAAAALRQAESLGGQKYSLTWSDGAASLVEIVRAKKADAASNSPLYSVRSLASVKGTEGVSSDRASQPVAHPPMTPSVPVTFEQSFIRRSDGGVVTRAARQSDGTITIVRQAVTETPMGDEEVSTHASVMREDIISHIRSMTMDHEGKTLYAGTDDGRLVRWQLGEDGKVVNREVVRAFSDGRTVTALALVLGDVSLAVGDEKGELTVWSPVNTDGTRKLQMIHELQSHPCAIREIVPSGRTKSLVSLDADGVAHLDHITSERRLLSLAVGGKDAATVAEKTETAMPQVALGPRDDALVAMDSAGKLTAWRIEGGCPEVSFKTLFGKVFYEGYDKPEYVWQTTGGEEFEPKFSLVPLVFGTLKGTFYAMLFAVPLALFAAMYVSYFTTPGFRRTIKPMVEIMATVPSVVIGFLIALWLAPVIERWALAFFVSLIAVPATFVAFMAVWQILRRFDWARRVENGYEFLVVLPVLLVGVALAACVSAPLEQTLFQAAAPAHELQGKSVAVDEAPLLLGTFHATPRWQVLAVLAGLVIIPTALFAFQMTWRFAIRVDSIKRIKGARKGLLLLTKYVLILSTIVSGAAVAMWLAGPIEAKLFPANFSGGFCRWLIEGPLHTRYDQRNNIIIAFGLGFTVIPIIFSISEDSLSNVPYNMTAASMAVGASRWQTLWRVVLPSASPGIFAATMIGFGRAVGETMIVLMATGNTPILDWSPLNGMRTLSANIAVEIPEAPVGGTLYRVLFLCAVLLFLLTFTVNTAAELVRQRLRKRFGRF
jgi:phosphate transport system permease protein